MFGQFIEKEWINLDSDLYQNSKVVYVDRADKIEIKKREKDYFSNFENADAEKELFERIFSEFRDEINDSSRNNDFVRLTNHFNNESIDEFNQMLNNLINNTLIS